MNRLVSVNLGQVRPDCLPPARPEDDRVRALFLTASFLGFGTYHRSLVAYAGDCDELDAVHVELRTSPLARLLGKSVPWLPRGLDQHAWRHLAMWRRTILGWLRGPLPIERFDVVHVLTEGNAMAIVDLAGRVPAAFAVNIDATARQLVEDFGHHPLGARPLIRAQRRIFDACDLIVGRNAWALESVARDFGIPADRRLLARNSMRPPARSRGDDPPRSPGEPRRIAFVGNAWGRKGGPELLRLHQERWADRAELHVLSRRASRDDAARNVHWHGTIDRAELLESWLPSMDLMVMPTREDMHPWAILEAMAAGLPVVSTRLAGIPEMVREGRTGHLCPPGDLGSLAEAVDGLLEDPVRCHAMGRAARAHVERAYDPDAAFGGLMERLVHLGRRARERGGIEGSATARGPCPPGGPASS